MLIRRAMESRPRMLLDLVRETLPLKHYSYRTEVSYINWIKRFETGIWSGACWRFSGFSGRPTLCRYHLDALSGS
jgi:hypothetical protein